jgi:hypothetical protein
VISASLTYAPYEARYFHDLLVELLSRAALAPVYVQHLAQIHSVLAIVQAGVGGAVAGDRVDRPRFGRRRLTHPINGSFDPVIGLPRHGSPCTPEVFTARTAAISRMTPKEMARTIGNRLLSFRVAGLDLPRVAPAGFRR